MNSTKKEDIILPGYEAIMDCIYDKFLDKAGQEFDYGNYSRALDKISQIASASDYDELEDVITEMCQNSAKHGFQMGARMSMVLLFGWQQGFQMLGMEEFPSSGTESVRCGDEKA